MAEEDYRQKPYVKVHVEYGWSTDEIEVTLYNSGFAMVEKKTHQVVPTDDAKKLLKAFSKLDYEAINKETSQWQSRDSTRIKLKLVGEKITNELWWDYAIAPVTKKIDGLVDELIELTRKKEEKK